MKKLKFMIMILAVVPLLITGCKKDLKNTASNVQFKMTDAPAHFDALNIDIQGIQAHTQAGGWVSLQSSLGVTNILNYTNGNATLVAEGSFPAGIMDQVNLVLGSNNSVVVNGTTYALSAAAVQSGLNISLHNQLQAGSNYVWTIDFDAAQSVTTSGSGSFQLNPVIRLIVDSLSVISNSNANGGGTATGGVTIGGNGSGTGTVTIGGSGTGSGGGSVVINGSTTGNISGSIGALGLASVCATGSNGSSVCTMTGVTGNFNLQALSSGSYTLTITPMVGLSGPHSISNITVTAGQTTSLGVVTM